MEVEKMKIKSEEAKGRKQDVPRKHPLNNIEKILLPKIKQKKNWKICRLPNEHMKTHQGRKVFIVLYLI